VIVKVGIVRALKIYPEIDTTLLGLLVEDGEDLCADITQSKFFLVESKFLADLIFTKSYLATVFHRLAMT
jgi:hypothetical protein